MRKVALTVSLWAGVSLGAACGNSAEDFPPGHPYGGDAGTTATGDDGGATGAGTGGFSGLPCDVQKIVEDGCIGCHGGTQSPRMLTYADLTAASPQYPGQTVAQRSLARMTAATNAMPPAPAVPPTPEEIAAFKAWVDAGTPMGTTCTSGPDAGTSGGGSFNTPTTCTSGKTFSGGNSGLMDPGRACLDCHQKQGGPRFSIGGTVYPTAHEPDNCLGVAGGLSVVVTDKNGVVTTLTVNQNGNFYGGRNVVPPFTAKVVDGQGHTRQMVGAVTAGDCNTCHTTAGANGAPGRIVAP